MINVYIAGLAMTVFGRHPERSLEDLAGEALRAALKDAGCDADELIALCKDRLGSVKAPKSVEFVDALPRSPVGKVLKKDLRAKYWQDIDRRI
jgi:acyl-CoA synthetase (AMP-forming)/AMP-acid ligase II